MWERWVALSGWLVGAASLGCSGNAGATSSDAGMMLDGSDASPPLVLPAWLSRAGIFVDGQPIPIFTDCRSQICRHNENTDMIVWGGGIYLVHRTAVSQTLGPDSALHVYRSSDGGMTFTETARIPAPVDRDLRDPAFFQVGGELYMKAITRLPVDSSRDSNVDSISVVTHTSDGASWAPLATPGPSNTAFGASGSRARRTTPPRTTMATRAWTCSRRLTAQRGRRAPPSTP